MYFISSLFLFKVRSSHCLFNRYYLTNNHCQRRYPERDTAITMAYSVVDIYPSCLRLNHSLYALLSCSYVEFLYKKPTIIRHLPGHEMSLIYTKHPPSWQEWREKIGEYFELHCSCISR